MKTLWCQVCAYLCLASTCGAQEPKTSPLKTFEFAKPSVVQDVDSQPYIVGRFDCTRDGSIDTLLVGYTGVEGQGPGDRAALIAVHPDGSVSNFPWHRVPGYTSVSELGPVFVGYGRISMLVRAQRELGNRPDYLVLVFDTSGSLIHQVALDKTRRPLILGAFESGDLIIGAEDQLNHRMVLSIITIDGKPLRELQLGSDDFLLRASQIPVSDSATSRYTAGLLISSSKFYPTGNHLILAPLGVSDLPIVELDEQGVVNSLVPRLPIANMVIESVLSANHDTFKLQMATLINEDGLGLSNAHGKTIGFATKPASVIAEVSAKDGALIRQIDIPEVNAMPACETNGTYHFLSSGGQGGLQVVTGHLKSLTR